MKYSGLVSFEELKLTPSQRVIYNEIRELDEEGEAYFKDSNSYMLWHIGFYITAIITLLMDLYLPSSFAFGVAIYGLIQHLRYRSKAKRIAHEIFRLEEDLYKNAMDEAVLAFKKAVEQEDVTR